MNEGLGVGIAWEGREIEEVSIRISYVVEK